MNNLKDFKLNKERLNSITGGVCELNGMCTIVEINASCSSRFFKEEETEEKLQLIQFDTISEFKRIEERDYKVLYGERAI